MNKTDLFLQMMQHPYDYTADEWQQMLADAECRELYMMMAKTQSAFDVVRADEAVTSDMIESEWKRLCASQRERLLKKKAAGTMLYKIAASFIGLLLISGIAFAAIHMVRQSLHPQHQEKTVSVEAKIQLPVRYAQPDQSDTLSVSPKLFDNVPLEQILTELSACYGIKVEYRSDGARQLRLFYQWKPNYTVEKVVEMLNNFESLQLYLKGDTLYVSSTVTSQP